MTTAAEEEERKQNEASLGEEEGRAELEAGMPVRGSVAS